MVEVGQTSYIFYSQHLEDVFKTKGNLHIGRVAQAIDGAVAGQTEEIGVPQRAISIKCVGVVLLRKFAIDTTERHHFAPFQVTHVGNVVEHQAKHTPRHVPVGILVIDELHRLEL